MAELNGSKAPANRVPRVDDALCQACRRCEARSVCRSKAIIQLDPGEPPFVDPSRCWGCLACIPFCPHGAIQQAE